MSNIFDFFYRTCTNFRNITHSLSPCILLNRRCWRILPSPFNADLSALSPRTNKTIWSQRFIEMHRVKHFEFLLRLHLHSQFDAFFHLYPCIFLNPRDRRVRVHTHKCAHVNTRLQTLSGECTFTRCFAVARTCAPIHTVHACKCVLRTAVDQPIGAVHLSPMKTVLPCRFCVRVFVWAGNAASNAAHEWTIRGYLVK